MKFHEIEKGILVVAISGLLLFQYGISILVFLQDFGAIYIFAALFTIPFLRRFIIGSRKLYHKFMKTDLKQLR